MSTKRHKQMVTLTLDPDLIERLKSWISSQAIPPPQNAVVAKAIEEFLARNVLVKESDQERENGR